MRHTPCCTAAASRSNGSLNAAVLGGAKWRACSTQCAPHGAGLPLPDYASAWAAGIDLAAAFVADEADTDSCGATLTLWPRDRRLLRTGIACAVPPGYEAQIRPRSGLALRHGVTVLNSPGTIDADYRGEVMVLLINHGDEPFAIRRGDRIAQLVVAPVTRVAIEDVGELQPTARGDGGFGSTGR